MSIITVKTHPLEAQSPVGAFTASGGQAGAGDGVSHVHHPGRTQPDLHITTQENFNWQRTSSSDTTTTQRD